MGCAFGFGIALGFLGMSSNLPLQLSSCLYLQLFNFICLSHWGHFTSLSCCLTFCLTGWSSGIGGSFFLIQVFLVQVGH